MSGIEERALDPHPYPNPLPLWRRWRRSYLEAGWDPLNDIRPAGGPPPDGHAP